MRQFISVDYLDILSRFSMHIVVGIPAGPAVLGEVYSEDWTGTDEEEDDNFQRKRGQAALWSERIQHTHVYDGCDIVIALSETSINRVLGSRQKVVYDWNRGPLCNMNVQMVTVRLLSSGKAIVYVRVEGTIAVKK
jgi:hypothetical protein